MILNDEYLSDEALEQLISEVEDGDLVPAPPELKDNILHVIFGDLHTENTSEKEETAEATGEMLKPPQERKKQKNRELAAYSFRVAMSAAAAVAFIFIMPYLPGFEQSENIREQEYPTREEVLNDTGILKRVFGKDGILKESDYFNIFMKKDGGQ